MTLLDDLAAAESPVRFGQRYFPATFTVAPAPMHRDIERVWLDRSVRQLAVVGPAGSAKSTVLRTCLLHDALFRDDLLLAVVAGRTDRLARAQLANLARLICPDGEATDSALVPDFGELRGERWNTEAIEIRKPGRTDGATCLIIALSSESGLKSLVHTTAGITQRPQIILADDAEAGDDGSEAEFRAFETFLADKVHPRIDWTSPVARLVRAENLSHPGATIARMFEAYPYRDPLTGEEYGECDRGATAQWSEWVRLRYDCYLRDGVTSYWRERWPESELDAQRRRLAPYPGAWERGFRTRPVLSGEPVFPPELLAEARCVGLAPRGREDLPAGAYVVLAVDDAKEVGARNDYSAIGVSARLPDGRVMLADIDWRKVPLGAQEEWIVGWLEVWRPHVAVFEDKRLMGAVAIIARQRGLYVAIEHVSRAGIGKEGRIAGMRPHLENGSVVIPAGTFRSGRTSGELRARLRAYGPGVEHDDPEDAMETAITRAMRSAPAVTAFTVQTEERTREELRAPAWMAEPDPESIWAPAHGGRR